MNPKYNYWKSAISGAAEVRPSFLV